jgi:uncharacterized protein (DUF58 family)
VHLPEAAQVDEDVLADLLSRRAPIVVPCRSSARWAGMQRTGRSGDGSAFRELREYRPGDPLRRLDPRGSARVGRWLVREVEREARLRISIGLADTPGLGYPDPDDGRPGPRKRTALATIGAAAVQAAGAQGHAVAVARQNDVPTPRGGRAGLREWLDVLAHGEATLPSPASLRGVELAWLLGDWLDPAAPGVLTEWAQAVALGVTVRALQVLHVDEAELPFAEIRRFVAWQGGDAAIEARGDDLRAGYRTALAAHQQALHDAALAAGVEFLSVVGPADWTMALRFLTAGARP